MADFSEFRAAAESPAAYARDLKRNTGRKVVGYFCSYVPEEIIFASGALPFRMFGSTGPAPLADSHLQSYCCSVVRTALEGGLSGGFGFLDAVVFPHTCDSLQRLSDLWRINVPGMSHLDLVLPVKLDTESSRQYLDSILRKFRRELEVKLESEISGGSLDEAISLFIAIRGELKKLHLLKSANPRVMSGGDLQTVVKASLVMERTRFLELLRELNKEKENRAGGAFHGKRLVVSGGPCLSPVIHRVIEEAGGAVVWDDLCTGSRIFEGIAENTGDPLAAIAARLYTRPTCPAKHSGLRGRGEHLLKIAEEHRADGAVFFLLKFCDPHAFDFPYLKETLERARVPVLLVDAEDFQACGDSERLRTRLETFIQML